MHLVHPLSTKHERLVGQTSFHSISVKRVEKRKKPERRAGKPVATSRSSLKLRSEDMLSTLPHDLLVLLVQNEAVDTASLYFLRFVCRSISGLASDAFVARLGQLLKNDDDNRSIMRVIKGIRMTSQIRGGPPLALSAFSIGQLLGKRVGLRPNSLMGVGVVVQEKPSDRGDLLRGWQIQPKELAPVFSSLRAETARQDLDEDDFSDVSISDDEGEGEGTGLAGRL